jgi:hypothetical protein
VDNVKGSLMRLTHFPNVPLLFGQTTRITAQQCSAVVTACRGLQGEQAIRTRMKEKLLEATGDRLVLEDYHCEPLPGGAMAVHTGDDIQAYIHQQKPPKK